MHAKQVEKQKEAGVKAAMEQAAEEYARETARLAVHKAETEAKLAEKVKKSRVKARKKEEAAEPQPEVCTYLPRPLLLQAHLMKYSQYSVDYVGCMLRDTCQVEVKLLTPVNIGEA